MKENSPLILEEYKKAAKQILKLSFPHLMEKEIEQGIDYSISKRLTDSECSINNNYTEQTTNLTLLQLTDYIISRQPIITPYGVLFQKHANADNPLARMIMGFINNRKVEKKKMFQYPKGSEEFEKHNLLQQLLKIDANGTYGALGQHSCLFHNLYVSSTVTTQGRSLISSASLQFEMFLNNNCKFSSLNEVVTFIGNIISERGKRKYDDRLILDQDVSREDCFIKVMMTCGFNYVPTEEDCEIVWNMILNMHQEDINRVYYKNNLYAFMENSSMSKAIIYLLQSLEVPYLDPNEVPDCIRPELESFCDLLMEYVYYSYQIIDRIDKYDNMYRSVSIITDTDSSIISLDGWYRYVLEKTYGVDMKIKHEEVDAVSYMDILSGEKLDESLVEEVDVEEYSFYDDDIVLRKRQINPNKIIAQDNLRYSIINIMAYVLDKVVNDYMVEYTKNSYSYNKDRVCLMRLKNEFLFRRVLLTNAKKNYASKQEIQEGNMIPEEVSLDVKGLPMTKSTLNKETRKRLKEILYEDILNADTIDQIRVLKSLAKFEKDIYNSLASGEKEYYKPSRIKSIHSYADPMRIQGIKASIVYNELRSKDMEPIDLSQINSIDVVKVIINDKTIESQKDKNPELYDKLKNLLSKDDFKKGITSLAIPINEKVPDWVLDFIDYNTIISDNIIFPIASLGVHEGNCNYTNIIRI